MTKPLNINQNPQQRDALRHWVAFYLEDVETLAGRVLNLTIVGFIVLSMLSFVIETYPINPLVRQILDWLDNFTFLVFTTEYCLRLWSAKNRLKFLLNPLSLVDLLVLLPYFLGTLVDVRFIRIFRSLRILRLIRFLEINNSLFKVSREDGRIFVRIVFTIVAIIFTYAGLIYQVEHPINPEHFATFLDSVYFAIVTTTTVGFGDVTPSSQLGRLLTVLMIFTGVILIPWQVGELIKQLVKSTSQISTPCPQCGLASHDQDAQFCKRCGTRLPTQQSS